MRMATASASGMEWLTAKNSRSNWPNARRWPSATSISSGVSRCSLHLAATRASVNREPRTGTSGRICEQERHGADVVLVAVREHDRVDVVQPVLDGPEVRQDQVDAGLLVLGEQHAAVHDQQPVVELEHGHVAADLADPAQRDHAQAAVGRRGWGVVGPGPGGCHRRPFLVVRSLIDQPFRRSCGWWPRCRRPWRRRARPWPRARRHRGGVRCDAGTGQLPARPPPGHRRSRRSARRWRAAAAAAGRRRRSPVSRSAAFAKITPPTLPCARSTRQHALVQRAWPRRRGRPRRRPACSRSRPATTCPMTLTNADRADRQPRQVQRVVAGVVGQVGAGDHLAAGQQVALGVLHGQDPRVFGQPEQRVHLDRHDRARRDVVQHHRQPGGVRDAVKCASRPACGGRE